MKKKIVAAFLVVSISCIAGAGIAPLAAGDIGTNADGLASITYNGTTYQTWQLGLGTTTRYYAVSNGLVPAGDSGVRAVWTAGSTTPTDIYQIPSTSNPKSGDIGAKADNFKWAGSDISSIDALPYMETMFAQPATVIFYFERGTGYDIGNVYGITGGVVGDAIPLTAAAFTSTAIVHAGGSVKAYVLTFDTPVDGVRFAAPGADAFTICTIPEPATMVMLGLGGLALLRKRS